MLYYWATVLFTSLQLHAFQRKELAHIGDPTTASHREWGSLYHNGVNVACLISLAVVGLTADVSAAKLGYLLFFLIALFTRQYAGNYRTAMNLFWYGLVASRAL